MDNYPLPVATRNLITMLEESIKAWLNYAGDRNVKKYFEYVSITVPIGRRKTSH